MKRREEQCGCCFSGRFVGVAMDLIQHWTDDVLVTPWAQLDAPFAWMLLLKEGRWW